jgi:tRNA(Ile2) C34 agmatinyltransferase TiaS
LYPGTILTWRDTGVDDVPIHVNGDERGCITVLATVSASRKKWSVFFIAKRKTERVEQSHIGDAAKNWHTHSESVDEWRNLS